MLTTVSKTGSSSVFIMLCGVRSPDGIPAAAGPTKNRGLNLGQGRDQFIQYQQGQGKTQLTLEECREALGAAQTVQWGSKHPFTPFTAIGSYSGYISIVECVFFYLIHVYVITLQQ